MLPDRSRSNGFADGAIAGAKILLVDDDFRNIYAMSALLERGHADVTIAESGSQALAILDRVPDIDIVLMDIMMPVMDGYDTMRAIRRIQRFELLPIIAVTGKAGIGERERCIEAGANDYVAKPVESTELLAALTTWLPSGAPPAAPASSPSPAHAPTHPAPTTKAANAAGPEERRATLLEDSAIAGTKILVVDDDFRNIFALSALLERGHANVTIAESGADALAALERAPDTDIVLMDIMMPVMDGYDTMRAIRRIERFELLPIIAVTGRVMAGERQRCLDAGASDYVPKPVDTGELLSVLRPWLPAPVGARP